MKELNLIRDRWTHTETEGVLTFGDATLYTIEQEWRPTDPGGQPNNSCIPAGRYNLRPHTRPNGDEVIALVNPGHAVYYKASDRPNGIGRFMILGHSGNWSSDVIGCFAPGTGRSNSDKGPMVTSSKAAMKKIMEYINGDEAVINITWKEGEPE